MPRADRLAKLTQIRAVVRAELRMALLAYDRSHRTKPLRPVVKLRLELEGLDRIIAAEAAAKEQDE